LADPAELPGNSSKADLLYPKAEDEEGSGLLYRFLGLGCRRKAVRGRRGRCYAAAEEQEVAFGRAAAVDVFRYDAELRELGLRMEGRTSFLSRRNLA
jgi:hypothetical protein